MLRLGLEPRSIPRAPVLPFKINSYVILDTWTITYIGGSQGLGEGKLVFCGDRVSVLQDEKRSETDGGDGRTVVWV